MTPKKIQEAEAGPLSGEQPPPAGLSSCLLEGSVQAPLEELLPGTGKKYMALHEQLPVQFCADRKESWS